MDLDPLLIAGLPKCTKIADLKGADSKYARDCAVRALMDMSLASIVAQLGLDPATAEVVIRAGIGTLVVTSDGNTFTPAPTLGTMAAGVAVAVTAVLAAVTRGEPVAASVETVAARQATCAACPHWQAEAMRCGACGCGILKLQLAASRCPKDRW